MTELEFKQAIAAMPVAQLLPLLHKMELAYNTLWVPASRQFRLKKETDDAVASLSREQLTAKVKTVVTIVFAALAVLLFILRHGRGGVLASLFTLVAFFFLICTVAAAITLIPAWISVAKLKKRIPQLEAELATETKNVELVKQKNYDMLLMRQWACPPEANCPENLRVFIKFFEDGRASNMKEAWNLFDEYIHRQRMENAANAQVAAARVAAIAAENAAFTAQQAKNSADRAAYNANNNW